jgi:hypothetical protein
MVPIFCHFEGGDVGAKLGQPSEVRGHRMFCSRAVPSHEGGPIVRDLKRNPGFTHRAHMGDSTGEGDSFVKLILGA